MQSLPIDPDMSGEGLVHWTFLEVGEQFQGAGTHIPSIIPCNMEKEEECHLHVDHASREG
jgi:hypothetical protein